MDKEYLNKMKTSSHLLPDPGGEVVRECIDEIERLKKLLLDNGGRISLGESVRIKLQDRVHRLEQEKAELVEALTLCKNSIKVACKDVDGCPFDCHGLDCEECVHAEAEKKINTLLGRVKEE